MHASIGKAKDDPAESRQSGVATHVALSLLKRAVEGGPVQFYCYAFSGEREVKIDNTRSQLNRQLSNAMCETKIVAKHVLQAP